MDEKYNGWKNYETWAVALWIDNEQSSQEYARELAEQATTDSSISEGRTAEGVLADTIKQWIEEQNPLAETATLFTDLLNAALSEVDWYEIAEHYLTKE
jgi:hypothetical protein